MSSSQEIPTPVELDSARKILNVLKVKRAKCILQDLKVQYEKKSKVARELLETERSYLRQLNLMVDEFEQPLRTVTSEKGGPLIPAASVSQIFPSVPLIRQVNSLFAHSLEEKMDHWSYHAKMGQFLLEFLPTLRIYIDFVSHFDEGRTLYNELMSSNPEFNAWMTVALKKYNLMSLGHLLIVPIQRIPRYRMLIAELVKYTPVDHFDHPLLQKAYDDVSSIADLVDSKKKEAESILFCRIIAQRLEKALIPVMEPGRRFVMEGPLTLCQLSTGKSFQLRWVVLFSDILLIGRAKNISKSELLAIPPTISSSYSEVAPKAGRSSTAKSPSFTYLSHLPLEQIVFSDRMMSVSDFSVEHEDTDPSASSAPRKAAFLSFSTIDDEAWGFYAASSEETRFWGERIMEFVRVQTRQKNFYEEQTIKVARSKALQTKNLLAEQYAALRMKHANPGAASEHAVEQSSADRSLTPKSASANDLSGVSGENSEQAPGAPKLRSFAIKRNETRPGGAAPLSASSSTHVTTSLSASAISQPSTKKPPSIRSKKKKVQSSTLTPQQLKLATEVASQEAPAEISIVGSSNPTRVSLKKRIGRRFGSLRMKSPKEKATATSLFETNPSSVSSAIEEPSTPGAMRSWKTKYNESRAGSSEKPVETLEKEIQ